ncbi:PREDICTED: alpha-L-iduronidase [Rhagoletis zephyria]|uniref:alpha-L-iduronidase n=1 Tax=Rhagoletis zephyria TaxID=28612 RepID=UPI0008119316|nr:PREDICTED: alpha-L-iduronidase [Rhagoletis zephyria]
MIGTLLLYLLAFKPLQNNSYTEEESYYELPRFWTSTGFCPMGEIRRESLKAVFFSEEVQMNLLHITALPAGAITHIRIHWLLKLVKFIQYSTAGVPMYDFADLDAFILNLDELGLFPVVEFMTDLDGILASNPDIEGSLWQDFSYQVTKHYLNLLGAKKLLQWRFETWNEPDVRNYNRLNFTVEGYLQYVMALRNGLTAGGRRKVNSLHFKLRGPAGLFKSNGEHPLCWSLIQTCNLQMSHCPIEVLTYHRKGQGFAKEVIESSSQLLKNVYEKYTNFRSIPVSNDEADPIAGWSTPQSYHEDVRYAAKLVYITFLHWHVKISNDVFKNLESISHDNAFISYHPYEFAQRTLLAHFRMNNSQPAHSQFIQKPVYAALGMLSKLATLAADVETITLNNSNNELWLLKTCSIENTPLYLSWLLLPQENTTTLGNFTLRRQLPFTLCAKENFAYIIEILEQGHTDPAHIWRAKANATPFPNKTQRAEMRYAQTPRLQATGLLSRAEFELNIGHFQLPWILLFRVCSYLSPVLKAPRPPVITKIAEGEIFIFWHEADTVQCLKTYEVWLKVNATAEWNIISKDWHLPFPSFQFAPPHSSVNGFYRVRGIDFFNRRSKFSNIVEYIEI